MKQNLQTFGKKHACFHFKLIAAFLFLVFLYPAVYGNKQQEKTIRIPAGKNTGLAVIDAVKSQFPEYRFTYDETIHDKLSGAVRVPSSALPVTKALNLLGSLGIDYKFNQHHIILSLKEPDVPTAAVAIPEPAKEKGAGSISGAVLDEQGEPLTGATILVLNTTLGTSTNLNGQYTLKQVPAGTHVIEARFISYETQQVSDVKVTGGKTTRLDLVMKPANEELGEVVVKAGYKQASAEGLYARQKNNKAMTDGISAEQIALTPDNNMGQVLKRISGVTTADKFVVVRGLSERYNQAMIDGVVLPSTDMNRRNFSFDVLPQELVSNVVVNKSATPDMSAEFSGGQISVNTLDIPTENFTSISIGTGYNSQSTGKDFLMLGQRGAWDYLGYDDGQRKEPEGIVSWQFPSGEGTPPPGKPGNTYPLIPGQDGAYSSLDAIAQSKKLSSEGLAISNYTALPYQNARITLGRVYNLKRGMRFGFTGGATYRNQQNIVNFNNVRGAEGQNYMDSTENGAGKSYRFSSTIGAVLNLGLQGPAFKLAFKNMYSHIYENRFYESYRLKYSDLESIGGKFRELFQDPQATEVWQHKLDGENLLGSTGLRFSYSGGITRIGQEVQDRRRLSYTRSDIVGGVEYYRQPNIIFPNINSSKTDYRMWTDIDETDYNWGLSLDRSFNLGSKVRNTAKIGYSGWHKHRTLGVTKMVPYSISNFTFRGTYHEFLDPENMGTGLGQAYYWAEDLNGPTFDGIMKNHAIYAMLDQRFFQKLRLVYGVRFEHYNLSNRQEDYIIRRFGEIDNNWELYSTTGEKNWRMLPSANLTYNLSPSMNLRAAYGKTAIRPDFRETAYFGYDDIELQANISGRQLTSTIVDNFDLRYEWYPSAGEIFSISGFYKKLNDPIELVLSHPGFYRFQNQHSAKNYGLEMEIRKSLDFIADKAWLRNLTVFGNGTILKSKVEVQTQPMPGETGVVVAQRLPAQDRPLYGQAPWIVNAGLSWQDRLVGFTVSYNRSGHRSNTINYNPGIVEYEKGRNLLDVQLSCKVLRQRGQLKLNLANLLDEYSLFYVNVKAYEQETDEAATISYKLVNGTTAYEKDKGDEVTYRSKTGRTASLSFTYNF